MVTFRGVNVMIVNKKNKLVQNFFFVCAAAAVVSTATLAAMVSFDLWRLRTRGAEAVNKQIAVVSIEDVRSQYFNARGMAFSKLAPYLDGTLDQSSAANLREIINQLVSLTVPPGEQQHHLRLVLALSHLEEILRTNGNSVSQIKQAQTELKQTVVELTQ